MWILWIFLLILLLAVVTGIILLRKAGGGKFPWVQFYLKGKESGFSFNEVNLLRRVAVENRMKDPTSLFWSMKQLDRCIKGTVISFRSRNEEHTDVATELISKLYDFRTRVAMNQPKYTMGLKTSREIANRQRIKITVPALSPFQAIIVDNLRRYMAISYPRGPKLPEGFTWKGQQIGVNLWREEDAGYYFQAKVIEDFLERKYPILHISHSENLLRTQKRRSVRAEASVACSLYPLRSVSEASEEKETDKGLRTLLKDISEDGAAILIGGRAKVGMPVKFQFTLSERTVVMSGVAKHIEFDDKRNRSLLHIQAIAPSAGMKNILRSYIYNIFGERGEEKPKEPAVKNKR